VRGSLTATQPALPALRDRRHQQQKHDASDDVTTSTGRHSVTSRDAAVHRRSLTPRDNDWTAVDDQFSSESCVLVGSHTHTHTRVSVARCSIDGRCDRTPPHETTPHDDAPPLINRRVPLTVT